MKRLVQLLVLLVVVPVLLAASVVVGAPPFWKTFSWNQRLTVTVQTPQGEVSGSAVTSVLIRKMDPCLFSGMSQLCVQQEQRGTATVVTRPDGQHLFALLSVNPPVDLAQSAFKDKLAGGAYPRTQPELMSFLAAIQRSREPGLVPRKAYPRLAYFPDLNDPSSVREVNPDDLAASFGPGYRLSSITLEVVDEPVSYELVDRLLPWLDHFKTMLDGNELHTTRATNRFANSLGPGNFKIGGRGR